MIFDDKFKLERGWGALPNPLFNFHAAQCPSVTIHSHPKPLLQYQCKCHSVHQTNHHMMTERTNVPFVESQLTNNCQFPLTDEAPVQHLLPVHLDQVLPHLAHQPTLHLLLHLHRAAIHLHLHIQNCADKSPILKNCSMCAQNFKTLLPDPPNRYNLFHIRKTHLHWGGINISWRGGVADPHRFSLAGLSFLRGKIVPSNN